ncbi:heme-binding protein [Mycobacterium sp. MS1601]|uniref:heme-binding protein n=1 Tax=Mycobacterium sp. MS1601 TaxID=1936029 RepID=UPI0018D3B109|nr:heme-binding protein [Mycobacterium sp. MS1601]
MIALPFETATLDYRLLMNQYNEKLTFNLVDKAVPNRGLTSDHEAQTDQHIVTLDYEQVIDQLIATDSPESTVAGPQGAAIHHEPGLFLHMVDQIAPERMDIGRLATIPHGNAALALGKSARITDFEPTTSIPAVNGLPIGVNQNIGSPYLLPYKFFVDNPFKGIVSDPNFPGFVPTAPHLLLVSAAESLSIKRTTILDLDTTNATGGIHNIPFVERQADATKMHSMFWIHELTDGGLVLQYLQVVILEFFLRFDGSGLLIGWPHVSINTLTKQSDTPLDMLEMATPLAREVG